MTSLQSNDGRRDDYLKNNSLQTDQFQTAKLIGTEVRGMQWPLPEGDTAFQLVTDATIHGVTKPLTWEVEATISGDRVVGLVHTTFKFDYFEMDKPSSFFVLSVVDEIRLEITISATIVEVFPQ